MKSITLVYQFSDGQVMDREVYDKELWKTYFPEYGFEDYFELLYEGNNYYIDAQTKLVDTLKQAIRFQKQQINKLIVEKRNEIKKLEKLKRGR